MKAKVLTEQGQPVQVVEITSDNGREQFAVVTSGGVPGPGVLDVVWSRPHENVDVQVSSFKQMADTARQALLERDAHMLTVMMSMIRSMLVSQYGIGQTITPTVLSPGGRRVSFEFDQRTLETGAERYEVIVRRKRA